MKKNLTIMLVLLMAPAISFAQLSVESSGKVVAGTGLYTFSDFHIGFQSGHTATSGFPRSLGIYGRSDCSSSTGINYGIMGVATNNSGGCGFGVTGCLNSSSMNGAGIFGSLNHEGSMGVVGRYAGYFSGNVKVSGTMTVNSLVQTSDLRLKENITSFGSRGESILDKVLGMNVVEYNYKKMLPSMILPDSISVEEVIERVGIDPNKKHIGLIAQELREFFPTLVEEGQDGYLAVNYVELVPVLIRAIQELKEELDVVKGGDTERKAPAATGVSGVKANGNVLYQNTPNPFKEQTVIRFRLADDAQDASICIFDMTGKQLKKLPMSSGMESVSIGGYELGQGMFLYSLVVNGQEVDTKKMIISK